MLLSFIATGTFDALLKSLLQSACSISSGGAACANW